jgi:hypothetical protein
MQSEKGRYAGSRMVILSVNVSSSIPFLVSLYSSFPGLHSCLSGIGNRTDNGPATQAAVGSPRALAPRGHIVKR